MSTEGPGTQNVAGWVLDRLWQNRDAITSRLGELFGWFWPEKPPLPSQTTKHIPDRPILIIGPGGSGKTTLARILAGDYDPFEGTAGVYAESLNTERYALSEDHEVEVVVPPGQEHRRHGEWRAVLSALAAGEYRGVILLAS